MARDGRTRRILMTALATTLLVAGCTGDPEPVTTPEEVTPTASPTQSPTPTPTRVNDVTLAPERPEAMAEASADGAAAAASYFLSLYPYVYATGDLEEWRLLSDPACDFCNLVADEVSDLHARKRQVTSPLTILASEGSELDPQRWYQAKVRVHLERSHETDAAGTVVNEDDAKTYDTRFSLTWADGWHVDAVGLEPTQS